MSEDPSAWPWWYWLYVLGSGLGLVVMALLFAWSMASLFVECHKAWGRPK